MIRFVEGDATRPEGDGLRVICHICNDRRAWGAGFVLALSRRWVEPERLYREHSTLRLGEVMLATIADDLMVANMVAQHGFTSVSRPVAVDYDALTECLGVVAAFCRDYDASCHMPRIGCGLGGGDWGVIGQLIASAFGQIPVTVYDLPTGRR